MSKSSISFRKFVTSVAKVVSCKVKTKISYNTHMKWKSEHFHLGHKVNFRFFHNKPAQVFRNHVPRQPWALIHHRGKGVEGVMEKLMGRPGEFPHKIGEAAAAGSALFGLGALCYYGLYITDNSSIQKVGIWQDYVRDRIKTTYAYFGGSVMLTSGASFLALRSKRFIKMLAHNALIVLGTSLACQIVSAIVVIHSEYNPGFGFKQFAWMVHSSVMGAAIAPMCFMGGPVIIKAFSLTAGVIVGLSLIAFCAPEGKFLSWSAPLGLCLGCIFTSSLCSFFLPPTTAIGAGLFAVYLYGGLVMFSFMLLYDTHKIIKQAEMTPYDDPYGFDPINSAMSLYMDALNIFVRFVQVLALQEVKKRKNK